MSHYGVRLLSFSPATSCKWIFRTKFELFVVFRVAAEIAIIIWLLSWTKSAKRRWMQCINHRQSGPCTRVRRIHFTMLLVKHDFNVIFADAMLSMPPLPQLLLVTLLLLLLMLLPWSAALLTSFVHKIQFHTHPFPIYLQSPQRHRATLRQCICYTVCSRCADARASPNLLLAELLANARHTRATRHSGELGCDAAEIVYNNLLL